MFFPPLQVAITIAYFTFLTLATLPLMQTLPVKALTEGDGTTKTLRGGKVDLALMEGIGV